MSNATKKTSKKTETVEQIAERLGVTVQEVKAALKHKEKEAAAIAKYGKGSGRINRSTGKKEELNIVKGSLAFVPQFKKDGNGDDILDEKGERTPNGGKWAVTIKCVDCQEERQVFTSDLFQVARCEQHQKEHKGNIRKAKRGSGKSNVAATAALLSSI